VKCPEEKIKRKGKETRVGGRERGRKKTNKKKRKR
jgi:hypothetical protein